MKRYVLTGTPGSGKTSILRALEIAGYPVVEEAATDVIALEHARHNHNAWMTPTFIDDILALQLQRLELSSALPGAVQAHDRAPICTHALCLHLGYPVPKTLMDAIARHATDGTYERKVFFIDNLGFVEPTAARKITYEDSLKFERIHEESYRTFGYELVRIARAPFAERVTRVREQLM